MRAAVACSGELRVDDVPDPVPGSGEALVAVKACGICGSDLHALRFGGKLADAARETGLPMPFDPDRDHIMGHEFCCEVLELGPDTAGVPVAPGDLVCSIPAVLTPTGAEAFAYTNVYPGGYSEQMLLTAGMCLKVPNGLDHRRASLTEPMAVGRHAAARGRVAAGDSALVFGAGPVGLAVVAELRRLGVDAIVASDYSPRRRSVATAMGATAVVDPANDDPVDVWERESGARPRVVFDAIGVPGTLALASSAAPMFARVVVVGSCMEPDTLRPLIPQVKQLDVHFSFAYDPFEFADTLRAIAEGEVDVTPMITGVCGIDGVPAAFESLGNPEEHVKILVEPGGPAIPTPV